MSASSKSLPSRLVQAIFGSRNERLLKRMQKNVAAINALEASMAELSDDALRAKTGEFRQRYRDGETLDDLLPEAFAVVRETGKRVLGMRHFDVQLVGGMVLHAGKIAEMRTGEGKTLVATLPAYLNALSGGAVHVITVNDYLARRDAEWMGRIYNALDMSVGVVLGGMNNADRKRSYACAITYGTNNEFGFDYLRDNMAFHPDHRVQRDLSYAIVDEVDSILIDEARTPLIISGPTDDRSDLYVRVDALIPSLTRQAEEDGPGDYTVDEKTRQVYLTEEGHERIEEMLVEAGLLPAGDSLYSAANISLMHHVYSAIRAHALFNRNVDYVVKDGEIVIVDEFTGRTMPGRRWSEGLHQAIEAKEGVQIQQENQTLASITYQNYFRLYDKLSGMTGTADTEAYEFQEIYGLEVVVIPTHKPMIRDDRGDLVYLTTQEKFKAISEDIKDCRERSQPVLVGTVSIETSEFLSNLLTREGIEHQVLNAKFHEKEAHIVANAGRPGAVTVATNMAGRGTDIVLGGSLEADLEALGEEASEAQLAAVREDWRQRHDAVLAAGGLHIIGTERHESRRIDNQLRGRAGRQGDPGSSRFYLSLEDSLMRRFASERVSGLMQKLGMQEDEAIEHPWVTRAIENAQRKVEGHNFDIRKQLLEFDDVANDQRKHVYEQRRELMEADDIAENIRGIRHDVVNDLVDTYLPPNSFEDRWDVAGLENALEHEFSCRLPVAEWVERENELDDQEVRRRVLEAIENDYAAKEALAGAENMRSFEKAVMLQVLDTHWKEHLAAMDHLRQGIHLRGFAQKNPKQEYKREAFEMFEHMLGAITRDVIGILSKVEVRAKEDVEAVEEPHEPDEQQYHYQSAASEPEPEPEVPVAGRANPAAAAGQRAPFVRDGRKIGRNEPCPCGSGKKYKQCHGRLS
ncbi:MAG: preprotein translocase subunit SecA [Gammaproteobacteria bacterium]|nr:preprotein translocase subunit SecA [Gammaproteobacteria bacterium]MCP5199378.1 preprotein translocase subunit SecA [Gammaproteobacteria bacterium]